MKDEQHIKAEILFEFARNAAQLDKIQKRHLQSCGECREVVATYRRWNSYIVSDSKRQSKAS